MKLRGFHLIRIFGIQIIIDYSWFVIFFLVIYSLAEVVYPQAQKGLTTPQYWTMGLIAATLIFLSVLLHELAHSFVAMKLGSRVTSIRLFIFGGVAQIASDPQSGRQEFLIAIAGPAMSMVLAFFCGSLWLILWLGGSFGPVSAVALSLVWANATLALFNLIPGFPLDGGRILRAILWDRWDDLTRATGVATQIGNTFALFLIILGILQILLTRSIVAGLWLVIIGLFMKQVAAGSYQAVLMRESLTGVRIGEIMTQNVIAVDWLVSVDALVRDYIYKYHFTSFPVLDREELVGMVSLPQVKSVPKDLWGFKQVRDIMTPIERVPCLSPADEASEVWKGMLSEGSGRLPVLEGGRLVGIVSRHDILRLLEIKSDLGSA